MKQQGDNKIKLTISILASNRKDTIPQCLESLKPLLERVNSELIITDTGCDQDLVEYMRGYTDSIIKFQWCDDFAEARNVGLRLARGQWFMFIDEDEWFEDVSELIDFFNSDESEKYESAKYIVRNYHTSEGKSYTEGVVGRVFRVHEETRFVGKVHEHVVERDGDSKQFLAYAHHYGYVFDSEEKRKAHFHRNSNLLKKEIEENPALARNYAHLYQEYKMVNEPDTILLYANRALESVDYNIKINKINMCSTYVAMLWAYAAKQDYACLIEQGEKLLKEKPVTMLAKAMMMTYMAEAYTMSQKYDKAIECVEWYLKTYDAYKEDRRWYYKEVGPMINDVYGDDRLGKTLNMGIYSAIKDNDLDKTLDYLLIYNWAMHIYMPESDCLKWFVDMLAERSDVEDRTLRKIDRVLGKIFTHLECSSIFLGRLTEIKATNPEGHKMVCSYMARVAGQPAYKSLAELIKVIKAGNYNEIIDIYRDIVNVEPYLLMMETEFYEMAIIGNVPLGKMICDLDEELWRSRLQLWSTVVRNKELLSTKKYLDKLLPSDSIHMKLLEKQIIDILESRKKIE